MPVAEVAPYLHSGALGVLALVLWVGLQLVKERAKATDAHMAALLQEMKAGRESFADQLAETRDASSERHANLMEAVSEARLMLVTKFVEIDLQADARALAIQSELRRIRDAIRDADGRVELPSESPVPPSRPAASSAGRYEQTETLPSRSRAR